LILWCWFNDNIEIQFNGAASTVNPAGFNVRKQDVTVPGDALSGQVVLQSLADNGTWLNSNALNFNIAGCSQNLIVRFRAMLSSNFGNCSLTCDQYMLYLHFSFAYTKIPFGINYNYNCDTDWQSPTPWPDLLLAYESQENYIDANIALLYS
jgi:hypothetical protein